MTLEIAGAMFPIFSVFQVSSYGGKDTKQSLSRGRVNIGPTTDGDVMDTELWLRVASMGWGETCAITTEKKPSKMNQ